MNLYCNVTLWLMVMLIGFTVGSLLNRVFVWLSIRMTDELALLPYRYGVIEGFTALLSLLLAVHFGPTPQLLAAFVLLWGLIVLFLIDLHTLLLPDQVTLPLLWFGLFCNTYSMFTSLDAAVYGAISGYLIFFVIAQLFYQLKKIPGLGQGDAKLLATLGAWLGWQLVPAIVFIASLMGSIWGIGYILQHKKPVTVRLPFGPFLVIAGLLALLHGQQILHVRIGY